MERIFSLEQQIKALIPREQPWQLLAFDSLPSTNTLLKQLSHQGAPAFTACLALEQTGGRGRLGRRFHSPGGQGLYMSVLLRPKVRAEALLPATGLAAVLSCYAIEEACGFSPKIKWLNDLYAQEKKLCGILAEPVFERDGRTKALILGLGLNLYQRDFPPELTAIATSLRQQGVESDYAGISAALLKRLYSLPALLEQEDRTAYVQAYKDRCISLNRPVELLQNGSVRPAYALDIDKSFGLRVKTDRGEETITVGEISVKLKT